MDNRIRRPQASALAVRRGSARTPYAITSAPASRDAAAARSERPDTFARADTNDPVPLRRVKFVSSDPGLNALERPAEINPLWERQFPQTAYSLGFSHDGTLFALISAATLYLLDATTGETRGTQTFANSDRLTLNGSFSPDGGSIVVRDGGRAESMFYCVDASNGKTHWKKTLPESMKLQGFLPDGTSFFMFEPGTLHCIDTTTGKTKWDASLPHFSYPSVYRRGRSIIVGDVVSLLSLDSATGKTLWRKSFPYNTSQRVASDCASVLTYTCEGNPSSTRFRMLDAATGEQRWEQVTEGKILVSDFSPDNASLIVIKKGQGRYGPDTTRSLDAATGNLLWEDTCESPLNNPEFSPNGALAMVRSYEFGTTTLHLFDASNGKKQWERKFGHLYHNNLAFSPNGRLVAVCDSSIRDKSVPKDEKTLLSVLRTATGEASLEKVFQTSIHTPTFSPDCASLAITSGNTISLFRLPNAGPMGELIVEPRPDEIWFGGMQM